MRAPISQSKPSQRGSVIVLVLALIAVASFFLSLFIERSMTEMLVESRARQSERLRAEAHGALETSLAVLADFQVIDEGLRSPAQGWGDPLAAVDFEPRDDLVVEVQVEDESGRISLPRLGQSELVALGRQFGLKDAEAERLADALLAWTSREHTSTRYETDPRNYEYAQPPHRVPGRPLASWDELASIAVARDLFFDQDGRPTKLYDDFVATLSLHDFPAVNLNSAHPGSLELAGLDESQISRILAYNRGEVRNTSDEPAYFKTVAEAQLLLGATVPLTGFDTQARCFRIRVSVREGGTTFFLTTVVVPASAASGNAEEGQAAPVRGRAAQAPAGETSGLRYPFKVLAFEENIQLASAPTL